MNIKAKQILKENKKLVDILAETLITKETLTKEEIEEIVKNNTSKPRKTKTETTSKKTSKE